MIYRVELPECEIEGTRRTLVGNRDILFEISVDRCRPDEAQIDCTNNCIEPTHTKMTLESAADLIEEQLKAAVRPVDADFKLLLEIMGQIALALK